MANGQLRPLTPPPEIPPLGGRGGPPPAPGGAPTPTTPSPSATSRRDYITQRAEAYGIAPSLALSMVRQESGGRQEAISPKGAIGLFQLMPETAEELGVDPTNPFENIEGGLRYFKQQLDRFGDVRLALAAYNAGPGRVAEAGGVPDIEETRNYVRSILLDVNNRQSGGGVDQPDLGGGGAVPPPDAVEPPDEKRGFFAGVAKTALPFQSVEEARQLASAVITDPIGAAKAIGGGILAAQGEQFLQAWGKLKEAVNAPLGSTQQIASLIEAGGRTAAGVVPLIGPAAAEAGEAIGEGETAFGVGQAVGLTLPLAVTRGVRVGRLRLKGLRDVRASRVSGVEPFPSVPLTRGQRTGSPVLQFAEALTEKVVTGRRRFQRFGNRQQRAIFALGDDLVERMSATPFDEAAGDAAQQAIGVARGAVQEAARARYQLITQATRSTRRRVPSFEQRPIVGTAGVLVDPGGQPLVAPHRVLRKTKVGGVRPETQGLRRFAAEELERAREAHQVFPTPITADAIDKLQAGVRLPRFVDYQQFQDVRSNLLTAARSLPQGKKQGLTERLAALTDGALESAARRSGIVLTTESGPMPLQAFVRETNALWKSSIDDFDRTVLKKMATVSPERVHWLLETADLKGIRATMRRLPEAERRAVKARLLRRWLDKDIQGEVVMPGARGIPGTGAPGPQARGQPLHTRIENLGRERMTALFGEESARELESLSLFARDLARRHRVPMAGFIANSINYGMFIGAGSVFLTPIIGMPALASAGISATTAIGFNIASRMMTHVDGLRSLRRLLKLAGQGRLPEAAVLSRQIVDRYTEQVEREQLIEQAGAPPALPPGAPPPELPAP